MQCLRIDGSINVSCFLPSKELHLIADIMWRTGKIPIDEVLYIYMMELRLMLKVSCLLTFAVCFVLCETTWVWKLWCRAAATVWISWRTLHL